MSVPIFKKNISTDHLDLMMNLRIDYSAYYIRFQCQHFPLHWITLDLHLTITWFHKNESPAIAILIP